MEINKKIFEVCNEVAKEMYEIKEEKVVSSMIEESKKLRQTLKDYNKPLLIQVAGNVGFGKTTVTEIIANQTGMNAILENDDDFLLKQYYNDMPKYAERLQTHLMSQRYYMQIIKQLMLPNSSLICDRTPYEDSLIFAEVLCKYGFIEQDSLKYIYWYFDNLVGQLQKKYPEQKILPDLVIYLHGDIQVGWDRVQKRSRAIEVRDDAKIGKGLTFEFYKTLHEKYDNFIDVLKEKNWYSGPVLYLDQSKIDVSDATLTKGWLYIVKALNKTLEIMKVEKEEGEKK